MPIQIDNQISDDTFRRNIRQYVHARLQLESRINGNDARLELKIKLHNYICENLISVLSHADRLGNSWTTEHLNDLVDDLTILAGFSRTLSISFQLQSLLDNYQQMQVNANNQRRYEENLRKFDAGTSDSGLNSEMPSSSAWCSC